MYSKWFRRSGAKRATGNGPRPGSPLRRRSRTSPDLLLQELERRTLLSVTASLSGTALDVNLSAANDQATITPSGSSISVVGTGFSSHSFAGVSTIVVLGANTSSQDDPDQSVMFGGTGGTISLDAASGTIALDVSGVTSVTFSDVTVDATSGDVNVQASEVGAPLRVESGAGCAGREIGAAGFDQCRGSHHPGE